MNSPPTPPAYNRRSRVTSVRLTHTTHAAAKRRANALGLTGVSAYVRQLIEADDAADGGASQPAAT